jgi:hypothetical protein
VIRERQGAKPRRRRWPGSTISPSQRPWSAARGACPNTIHARHTTPIAANPRRQHHKPTESPSSIAPSTYLPTPPSTSPPVPAAGLRGRPALSAPRRGANVSRRCRLGRPGNVGRGPREPPRTPRAPSHAKAGAMEWPRRVGGKLWNFRVSEFVPTIPFNPPSASVATSEIRKFQRSSQPRRALQPRRLGVSWRPWRFLLCLLHRTRPSFQACRSFS